LLIEICLKETGLYPINPIYKRKNIMRYLKTFESVVESEDTEATLNADSWVPSETAEADYDVTWKSTNGEEITASFRDLGGPIQEEGKGAYSEMETVTGSSSDGIEYSATVEYIGGSGETEDVFQVKGISISKKV
jgi:hypothetical protein